MENNKMFGKKSFQAGSGWILAIFGIGLYIVGYFFIEEKESLIREILIKIADVLVIGGVIGFLTNAAHFFGIFKGELQEIIYGKKFLSETKHIETYWDTISKQMFKNKFKFIHRDFLLTIKKYFFIQEVIYYNDYEVHCDIVWVDENKGIMKVTDRVILDLIADSTADFEYQFTIWSKMVNNSPVDDEVSNFKVNDCLVAVDEPKVTVNGNSLCKLRTIPLKGSTKYKISYIRTRTYSIFNDYCLGFRSKYIVNTLRVNLTHPKNIIVDFYALGTQNEFATLNNTETNVEYKYEGIILPKQGYIFAFRKSD